MFTLSPTPLQLNEVFRSVVGLFGASFLKALPYSFLGNLVFLVGIFAAYGMRLEDEEGHAWLWIVLLTLLAYPALMSAVLYRIEAYATGREVRFGAPLARALACFASCFLATLAYCLAVGLGFILLLIPGMYLTISLIFWYPALVLDERGIAGAFRDSAQLAYGNWWRAFINFSVMFGFYALISAAESKIDTSSGNTYLEAAAAAIGILVLLMLPMLACAAMVITYHDLKLLRKPAVLAPGPGASGDYSSPAAE